MYSEKKSTKIAYHYAQIDCHSSGFFWGQTAYSMCPFECSVSIICIGVCMLIHHTCSVG
jgi:hypothetical protein